VFCIQIRIALHRLDPDLGGQDDPGNEKIVKMGCFKVLGVSFEAGGFSCSLYTLYGGIKIDIFQFLKKKNS
jgi:hypothetical protein